MFIAENDSAIKWKGTPATHSIGEPPRDCTDQKIARHEESILCDSISAEFKNKQDDMVIDVRIVATVGTDCEFCGVLKMF